MRIQHNIMAMSAYRNYTSNVSAMKKNLEKLSSGYKINRAGDDAAGLAISEKMRAQITGLETAQKNAKDGISLVQTAEGALTEVHDMLNRMVELATQSANGTYDNTTDRAQMQKEIVQLRSEIDRIADSSNFNGIKLFDGSMEAATTKYEVTNGADLGILDIEKTSTDAVGKAGTSTIVHTTSKDASKTSFSVELSNISFVSNAADTTAALTIGGVAVSFDLEADKELKGSDLANAIITKFGGTAEVKIGNVTYGVKADGSKLVFEMTDDAFEASKKANDAASFTGNFAVAVVSGTATQTGSVNVGTQIINEGNKAVNGALASTKTSATVGKDFFADGKTLTVGDVTYVFASTQKTLDNVKAAGGNFKVVDLTDISKDGALDDTTAQALGYENALTEAGARLTRAAEDNKMFTVGHNNTDGVLTFQEKEDYNGDGKGGRADLTTGKGIQAQLKTGTFTKTEVAPAKGDGKGLMLQIGDTAEDFNQLRVSLGDMHCSSLKDENGVSLADIKISDQDSAAIAVDVIKAAINQVSDVRGTLGATQNRLDHTINNLSVMTENIQDAESTIRDVDIAEEMMAYTKNNILIQSAQAMLAQANQVPQGVLQLLG